MKKRIWIRRPSGKKWIAAGTAVVVTCGLVGGALFRLHGHSVSAMAEDMGVQSAVVKNGNITTTVIGTGNLENTTAEAVTFPAGVEVETVLVESGEQVKKGDVLATLDSASLTAAMISVQEEIEELDDDIEDAKDDTASSSITAGVSGTVKKIYAESGQKVSDVMAEKGALILLAADDDSETEISVTGATGTVSEICVSEGEEIDAGDELIQLEDVSVSAEYLQLVSERRKLTSRLQELSAAAKTNSIVAEFDGTIQSVNVAASASVSAETDDTESSRLESAAKAESQAEATAAKAESQAEATAAKAESQAEIAAVETESKTEAAEAKVEGKTEAAAAVSTGRIIATAIVSGSRTEAVSQMDNGKAAAASFVRTSAASDSQDESETEPEKESEKETEKESETESETEPQTEKTVERISIASIRNVVAVPQTGQAPQGTVEETEYYTGTVEWNTAEGIFAAGNSYTAVVTLYAKQGDGYQYVFPGDVALSQEQADIVVVSVSDSVLKYQIKFEKTAEAENTEAARTQDENEKKESAANNAGNGSGNGAGNQGGQGQQSSKSSGSVSAGGSGTQGTAGGGAQSASAGTVSTGSTGTAGSTSVEEDSDTVTAFTISPDETMMLTISVDELDILSVEEGQTAAVTFDALEEQTFEGTISGISDTASVNGGVAKYTVEIEIPKDENMRAGMNASATITVEDKQDILLIPAASLQERGNSVFVYTEQGEDGTLSGEVQVETGLSDGTNVEIVSGLSEGQTVYYTRVGNDNSEGGFNMEGMHNMRDMQGGGERPDKGNFGGNAGRQDGAPTPPQQ